jgi:hypothetical protein
MKSFKSSQKMKISKSSKILICAKSSQQKLQKTKLNPPLKAKKINSNFQPKNPTIPPTVKHSSEKLIDF